MSLGGMHDESELRGHRRTYIGAMPGRVITALRRAGSKNPVLLLDEVDKLGRDFRGCRTTAAQSLAAVRRRTDGTVDDHAGVVVEMMGPEPFHQESMRKTMPPGVATGLAWTEAGGDVLYIEATRLPSGKGLTLTGQLGEVMQESAKTAQGFVWSRAGALGIPPEVFKDDGVHVHLPAGAIPKDGPSAGVTMVVAMTSMHTKLPMRADTAMTGEVTLTGLVLPIGGVKEKVLAARRAGLKRVILPKANEKDLRDVPENVRKEMEFVFAERIEQVLEAAIPALQHSLTLEYVSH